MKISLNWLNDYVDLKNYSIDEVCKALTDSGLEVEAIEEVSTIQGKVIVGEILKAEKHPDADTLKLCSVNVGQGEPLDIVCGAPNARVGIKACVALVGSILPGDFKIKKSKIRGVISNGMMCAEDELGLSKNHDTIIEVDANVAIGTSVAKHFRLNDTAITLGLTPNRGDCLGYIGVARDLAAKLELPLKNPLDSEIPLRRHKGLSTGSRLNVIVEDEIDCPRFAALAVENLQVSPSPQWIQKRLLASGMRPISNIVDVTNYVMLETGQPIHAYDVRDIRGAKIQVRKAHVGETLTTLDGQKRELEKTDLLICDAEGPIGLAGVMGGLNSEVKEDTSSIIIEVAKFDAKLVRKTARRLALHTEASHRFERSVDVEVCASVAARVAQLLQVCTDEAGRDINDSIQIAEDALDQYPGKRPLRQLALRLERARMILGLPILGMGEIRQILARLGITSGDSENSSSKELNFSIPSWRNDLQREIDLIEEVGRIIGYSNIPFELPAIKIGGIKENPFISFVDDVRKQAASIGLNEIISFPFLSSTDLDKLGLEKSHIFRNNVELANPISETEGLMRPTLIPGLLKAASENRRHGRRGVKIFEAARSYLFPDSQSSQAHPYFDMLLRQGLHLGPKGASDKRAIERSFLGFLIDQPLEFKRWFDSQESRADFFSARATVEKLCYAFGFRNLRFQREQIVLLPYLHPQRSTWVYYGNLLLGYVGELHPEAARAYDFDAKAAPIVAELSLEELFEAGKIPVKIDATENKFPPVLIDLAFVVSKNLEYAKMEAALAKFQKRNLKTYRIFDLYEGDNIGKDKKSVALSFSFQSNKRTLNDKEVEAELDLLKAYLQKELGTELR